MEKFFFMSDLAGALIGGIFGPKGFNHKLRGTAFYSAKISTHLILFLYVSDTGYRISDMRNLSGCMSDVTCRSGVTKGYKLFLSYFSKKFFQKRYDNISKISTNSQTLLSIDSSTRQQKANYNSIIEALIWK